MLVWKQCFNSPVEKAIILGIIAGVEADNAD